MRLASCWEPTEETERRFGLKQQFSGRVWQVRHEPKYIHCSRRECQCSSSNWRCCPRTLLGLSDQYREIRTIGGEWRQIGVAARNGRPAGRNRCLAGGRARIGRLGAAGGYGRRLVGVRFAGQTIRLAGRPSVGLGVGRSFRSAGTRWWCDDWRNARLTRPTATHIARSDVRVAVSLCVSVRVLRKTDGSIDMPFSGQSCGSKELCKLVRRGCALSSPGE